MTPHNFTTAADLTARTQGLLERSSLSEDGPRRLRRRASRDQVNRIRELLTRSTRETRTDRPENEDVGSDHIGEQTHHGLPPDPHDLAPAPTAATLDRKSPSAALERLIARIALQLTDVDHTTAAAATERILAGLIEHLDVDFGYLRRIDRERQATVLVAEWPRRTAPDPDPLDVVYFDQAYSPLHSLENITEPTILHAVSYFDQQVTSAVVPLLLRGESIGLLGFVKHGDWVWSDHELGALEVLSSMLTQLQARIDAEMKVRYVAAHDDLTGLPNQHALMKYMEQRLRPGHPGPVAALCVSLNRLTTVNNHLGRTAGDNILRTIAARLRDHLEQADMIARIGDEFVIVPARPMDAVTAEFVAAAIQQGLIVGVTVNGKSISCGISVGVGVGIPGEAPPDVLRRADLALRAAKTQDGNGVAVYTDVVYTQFELQDDLTLSLHSAVSDDSLILHYQPEVDLLTGRILGLEALVRWQHPTRGLLAPDRFVGVAEATNLAGELGDWVIRTACAQFAAWRSRGLASDIVMRINTSPRQLINPTFVERVEDAFRQHNLDGGSVCLEITENVSVQDMNRTHETLHALKRLNVQIAIDDFGTGYNTLSHLKALPVDTVKIDRSFVKRLTDNAKDRAIVESIVGLARSFDLEVIGEGVETAAVARALIGLGCHRAQGFLIARPLPAEEIETHLLATRIALPLEKGRSTQS